MSDPSSQASELSPRWLVTVSLDGDDYPPTATEIAEDALTDALIRMKHFGQIVGYTLERVKP